MGSLDCIKGVVYQVPCECGHVYVGETGRNLKLRLTEHKRAVKNKDPNNGLAVHVNITNHTILWNSAEVLTTEPNWSKRKVKEALYIKVAVHVCSLIIHELQAKILCEHCIKMKRATMAQRQVTEAPRTVLLQQS